MLEDFAECQDQRTVESDVCIIGAGAAGITLARALKDSGLEVCLLESGGRDYEQASQELAAGDNLGLPYYDLVDSRLRFFGGTTAIWGGRVAELDAIDFERRSWIPHSGWPINKDVLRPYYDQALDSLGLNATADNRCPAYEARKTGLAEGAGLTAAFWQFDETFERFTLPRCADLESAPRVKILLHATALRFRCNAEGRAIESLEIANLKGGRGEVKAKRFVLATGGLEVPRLLLASRAPAHPQGLGNSHDLVGRFFMEHPRARGAEIETANPRKLLQALPRFLHWRGQRYGMLLRPGEALQEAESALNTGFTLAVRKHAGGREVAYKALYNSLRHSLSPTKTGRGLWQLTRRFAVQVQDSLGAHLDTSKLKRPGYGLYAVLRAEQAPNPESRVVLTEKRDALGLPQIALDWRLSTVDKHSVQVAMAALDRDLEAGGLGRAKSSPWLADEDVTWETDALVSNHALGGYHHLGTARMAENPKDGVVDAEGRVHGLANLHVAGSAVFPTGGWANPTLTILALALRLAETLKTGER